MMTTDQTKDLTDMVARMVCTVSVEDARALVAEFESIETLMPILDPTRYRRVAPNIPGHLRAAQAFLSYRKALQEFIQAASEVESE